MRFLKAPYILLLVLASTHLFSQKMYASKSKAQALAPNSVSVIYFDVPGEQAFVLKERIIKNKKEYFLSFRRGQQTYGSVLISKGLYQKYQKALEGSFKGVGKTRKLASVDSCHEQVSYQKIQSKEITPLCLSQLSLGAQKKLKNIISNMNKKVYGVHRELI